MSLFGVSKSKPEIGGIIKYFDLDYWWLKELTDDEKEMILDHFNPLGGSDESIIEGKVTFTSQSSIQFMSGLASWFSKPYARHIAYKIIKKAETLIDNNSPPIDVHFLYSAKVGIKYRNRDSDPNGLIEATNACKQQISYAHLAAKAFIKKYNDGLPSHKGYEQLAIILEKQKEYNETINLCESAMSQGWAGQWEKRIERCNKKIDKNVSN